MNENELQKETAQLRRLYKEFPFLSHLISRWHPECVDVGVYTMDQDTWKVSRYKCGIGPIPTKTNVRLWLKIKVRDSSVIFDDFVEVTSLPDEYILEYLVKDFRVLVPSLRNIEYIVEETIIKSSGRKIILVFRPPKGQKAF
jgi:hypothetical protein